MNKFILEAIQSSSKFNQTSIKDIEVAASIWLSKASERLKMTTINDITT